MNVRYALKWLRYQHFWRFVYRPVKPYDTGIYLYFGLPRSGKSTYAAKLAKKALTVTFLSVVLFKSPKTI